jgi:quercetin dioxygenase-like cupin family protein
MKTAAALLLTSLSLTPAIADTQPSVLVTKILEANTTVSGGPIVLPAGPVNVSVSKYVIQPGATLPVHRHVSQRYAYVISGTLDVRNAETGDSKRFDTGSFVLEGVGYWHSGSNVGKDPVVLLVIDQTSGPGTNVELQK